jgi:hypothetical protein
VPRNKSKPLKPVSKKQRAKDEELREELRQFDLKKFDRVLERAIKPKKQ